ncbi:MAG: acetyl-CoA carboxylase, biotin carboxyl carrier protein [Ignavibacteria bacterium RIFOXYB2_FULL_35_12]|nr:MAG: acetyl-CoA carboxylase, biotin carboxyl carrier protein [Ignavibacteria bacterium GWA2_36_19]OGU61499.1 MAG: acetyl-CoA carboxylase, biotin carboxyl carrier protein [Ignavibacteria bacterium GWF2_35_20]OGU85531.1 MAG: acetyl-CoA carboxylase, biotin carboxyl carrier protein [Ignavibacteria bacterium RIFOXYA12_FULL_35_25]OGU90300.1 MAG: acetyl-CoA carboxylase, biotin carboxyl carrier protein [Ignavibacteria bacterium RIFOXYC12_FULL_35_11]OGU96736.1 MAG: acetyl-CoA carboxylase, biotin carb
MDLNLIKKLIKIFDSSEITDLEIEQEGFRIKIAKKTHTLHSGSRPHVVLPPASVDEGLKDVTSVNEKETKAETRHEIRSPIVGTFYLAPGPDADPYVQVGDIVTKGSVLCIVEAMKLMNEIESDTEGRIVKILVENGKPVEFNQPLFLIQPN